MKDELTTTVEHPDVLLTYREVQTQFAIPRGTLFFWVHSHQIPHLRLGPRTVRFRRSELQSWLNQRAVAPQPQKTVVSP